MSKTQQIGTSVQWLEKIYPELVNILNDSRSVDYGKISIIVISELKNLSTRLNDIEKELSIIEIKINEKANNS